MIIVVTNACGSKSKITAKEQMLKLNAKDPERVEAPLSFLKPQPRLDDYHPLNAPFESD